MKANFLKTDVYIVLLAKVWDALKYKNQRQFNLIILFPHAINIGTNVCMPMLRVKFLGESYQDEYLILPYLRPRPLIQFDNHVILFDSYVCFRGFIGNPLS